MKDKIIILAEHIITFDTFQTWVNKASSWIGGYPSDEIICVASDGTTCLIGKDMMCARENNLFPVKVYRLVRTSEISHETKNEER